MFKNTMAEINSKMRASSLHLRSRHLEGYATAILYGGGLLLTLAIATAGALTFIVTVDRYINRQVISFYSQIDEISRALQTIHVRTDRLIDIYVGLMRSAPDHKLEFRTKKDLKPASDVSAGDCPMNIFLAAGFNDMNNLPCSSEIARNFWKAILNTCQYCGLGELIIFDRNGKYLVELTRNRKSIKYKSDDYINSEIKASRDYVNVQQKNNIDMSFGKWVAPHRDPDSGDWVVEYIRSFRLSMGPESILVRRVVLSELVASVVPEETRRSLVMLHADGIADFSGKIANTIDQRNQIIQLANLNNHGTSWHLANGDLYIMHKLPEQQSIWIRQINKKQVFDEIWRDSVKALAPFFALLVCMWLMIVIFERRVLSPIKRRAEKGRESSNFEQAMVDSLPIGFAAINSSNKDIVLCNERAREIVRLAGNDELLSVIFSQSIGHDFSATPTLQIGFDITRKEDLWRYEFSLRRTTHSGESILLMTIYDISAHYKTEALLLQAKVAAEEANRAKSDFLAIMSHEIRTPLHGALSNLELLSYKTINREHRDKINVVQKSFESLLNLLNNALDFSKIDAQLFSPNPLIFNIRKLIEQIIFSVLPSAENKNIIINYSVNAESTEMVFSDQNLINQVVLNLLHNALKNTTNGKISINCRCIIINEDLTHIEIEISDTGRGISKQDLPHIFDPYIQSDSQSQTGNSRGTGLGLALCKKICVLLGGEIQVKSEIGVGSTFSVRIPFTPKNINNETINWTPPLDNNRVNILLDRPEIPSDFLKFIMAAGWDVNLRTLDSKFARSKTARESIQVLITNHNLEDADFSMFDLVVADNGPIHPTLVNDTYFTSAYSLSGIQAAWHAMTRGSLPESDIEEFNSLSDNLRFARALVVDDDEICRDVLARQLTTLGIQFVDVAADGDEGLHKAKTNHYHIIYSDLSMPFTEKRLFVLSLIDLQLKTPIVLTTANIEWEKALGARRDSISDVMIKPSPLAAVRDSLVQCLPDQVLKQIDHDDVQVDLEIRILLAHSLSEDYKKACVEYAANNKINLAALFHKMSGGLFAVGENDIGLKLLKLEKECLNSNSDNFLEIFNEGKNTVASAIEKLS